MPTLIKCSAPGWETEFDNELDLFEELWDNICNSCMVAFKHEEGRMPADYDELLSTACGAEFMVEEDGISKDI